MNKWLWSISSLALALVLTTLLLTGLSAAARPEPPTGRPAKVAAHAWQATANGEAEFLLLMAEQANLDAAGSISDREVRLRYVHRRLKETAVRAQAPLRAELDTAGVEYRAFYVANLLLVTGDRALMSRLASRPDVARIEANPQVRQSLPEPRLALRHLAAPEGIEWGVRQINADDVWALGYTGQGIVVGGQDTGYDWDHPALRDQYRGWNGISATHDYHWHDAIHSGGGVCGADSPVPCDDHGHGTHTMGTIVGDDGGSNQIGVAPGARWIGCRNMDRGVGSPVTYIECFQWFLAPTDLNDQNPDPARAPHVINNSWACPPWEGCAWDSLQATVENVRAAGIVVVVSAGNEGSGCTSVQNPPAIYDASFSVGATDSNDNVAAFSSRGPVTVDGSDRLKPDVAAPGVSVSSCVPGTGYSTMQGTSMAAPHVAGTVALLYSAAPHLVGDVDGTEGVITGTARPRTTGQGCGGDGPADVPNHVYGWGIVDALAAVQETLPSLQVTKQAPAEVASGARLTYALRVTNTGGVTLTAAITDLLPAQVTTTGPFSWSPVSIPPTAIWTETVAVTVHPGYEGSLTNVIQATAQGGIRATYTATTEVLAPYLVVTKETAMGFGLVVQEMIYTLRVTNPMNLTLHQVVITDTVPTNGTFARASGNYTYTDGVVTWTTPYLTGPATLTASLVITISHLPPGTDMLNAAYGARADEVITPAMGVPVRTIIPYRYIFPLVFKGK